MSSVVTNVKKPILPAWVTGEPGRRPVIFVILLLLFVVMIVIPPPASMVELMEQENPMGAVLEKGTTSIVESYNKVMKYEGENKLDAVHVAGKAKIAVALLLFCALLWGTESIPLGATDILAGVVCYLFSLFPLAKISQAYMKDAVLFIAGVLCIAAGVSMTGLDKRIGFLLLGKVKGMKSFAFVFFLLLAVLAAFFSEHALVALMMPILMLVYTQACKKAGVRHDKHLGVFLFLGICFAANIGGSGSPAVGGRSAIMVGYFQDYNMPISFGEWMMYGFPLVPILAITTAIYMWFTAGRKVLAKDFNISATMKENIKDIGPLKGKELIMAILFLMQVVLWIFFSGPLGLGGTTITVVFIMLVFGVVTWKDLQHKVAIDVVLLYAAACLIGTVLNATGGALWMANQLLEGLKVIMPNMADGGIVLFAVSLITGVITNFMSDGATVGAVGPVVLPMAEMSGIHLWKVGLACSFTSSFAHAMICGTVNNAIAYSMARDPETGEHIITVGDFLKYGVPFVVICILVTFVTCFFGYWNLLPWPSY